MAIETQFIGKPVRLYTEARFGRVITVTSPNPQADFNAGRVIITSPSQLTPIIKIFGLPIFVKYNKNTWIKQV